MDDSKRISKQQKQIKFLIISNIICILILAMGIVKDEKINIGIVGVNAANATYDIDKPNTWPTNTEISFGNNVYGVRKSGTLTVAKNTVTQVQIITTAGVSGILAHGGYWKVAGGTGIGGPGTSGGNTFTSWYSGTGSTPNNTLYIGFSNNTALTNDTYDFWILYTK